VRTNRISDAPEYRPDANAITHKVRVDAAVNAARDRAQIAADAAVNAAGEQARAEAEAREDAAS
jgi:hypothetical protein